MILISSATYVGNDLVNEFGKLPPSFLPVQNLRLFHHQINLFRNAEELIILSIPEDFIINDKDDFFLKSKNIRLMKVPLGLSLGASITFVLNMVGLYHEPLKILYGDTLFNDIVLEEDVFYISRVHDNYKWDYLDESGESLIFAGFFSFVDQKQIINCITKTKYDFLAGVREYKKFRDFRPIIKSDWMDFGLASTYFRSKSSMTTQRVFNDLKISKYSVLKSSDNKLKMLAEANWFESIPFEVKYFTPSFFRSFELNSRNYYEIEYLNLNSLADLFVFGKHPVYVWKEIFESCQSFINISYSFKSNILPVILENSIYCQKTLNRLNEYSLKMCFDLNQTMTLNGKELPSINEIVQDIDKDIAENLECNSIIHGDFCFSNILYDFRKQAIKVIDPRGLDFDENLTIYGDARYDIAKLAHSVLGLYDLIIGGYYDLKIKSVYDFEFNVFVSDEIKLIQKEFLLLNFFDKSVKDLNIYPIVIHLFLSMLPLHCDNINRQTAFLANALQMYSDYNNLKD